MSETVRINVKVAGKTYSLRAEPQYEALIRREAERLDREFRQFKLEYAVADEADILVMLLLKETAAKAVCLDEREKTESDLKKRLDELEHLTDGIETIIKKK